MDHKKVEAKWQGKWEKAKIFQPKIDRKRKKFFFTTPYPYISGSLHIGHARAVTESDVYCRYMRMAGYNVLYPMAFHVSGTPVLGFAKAIENKDPKMINLYTEYVSNYEKDSKKIKQIVESFKDPEKIIEYFIPLMMKEYSSLGISVDWSRVFNSASPEHQALVSWQFKKYKDKKYLIKGSHPNLYCINCQNAVGEDDIKDADIDPVEKQEFTLLKFQLGPKSDKTYLLAATLRPETVYGQTNLWVNPNTDYAKIKVGNEYWIVSQPCVEKLTYQKEKLETVDTLIGQEFIGKVCIAPGIKREIPILPALFCDPNMGTGIVTSVPSDAPYDYIALEDLKNDPSQAELYGFDINFVRAIEVIPIIQTKKWGDAAAVKICKEWNIQNQEDPKLEEATKEVYKEGFHTGILNENCGKYSGKSVLEAKDLMKAELLKNKEADLMYEPSRPATCRCGGRVIVALVHNQWFLNFNAKGWKPLAYECLKSMIIKPDSFRKQFEDTFAWLDKRPCARRRGLGTELPFEKGWMIESLSDSTMYMALYTIMNKLKEFKIKKNQLTEALFDYIYLNKGEVKILGKDLKISPSHLKELKESFDYWYPNDHRHTFSLHLSNHLSFFIFAHAGLLPKKYWPKKISFHGLILSEGAKMSKSKGNVVTLLDVKNKYGADLFRAYLCSASMLDGDFNWTNDGINSISKKITNISNLLENIIKSRSKGIPTTKWYLSKFERCVQDADKFISDMNLRDYTQTVLFTMPRDYTYFKRRCASDLELRRVNEYISEKWVKLLSPLIPHISEELWSKLKKKGFVSIANWPKSDSKKIDDAAEEAENGIMKSSEDIHHILKMINKAAKGLFLYVIPKELETYKGAEDFLSKEFNAKVKVFAVNDKSKYDPENKAQKAKPGKPGIYIE